MKHLLLSLLGIRHCRACTSRTSLQHFERGFSGFTLCGTCARRISFALRAVLAP